MDLIFQESREKIAETLEQVENIGSITEDPTCYINQHFDLNINHIRWRRIDLIEEIDQYCDQLLEENESNRTKCLKISNETNQITKRINETKEELHLLKKRFDAFDSNITKLSCELSQMNANYLMEKFCFMHEEYKKSLLQHKDFFFICYDRPIEDIVGKLVDEKKIVEENLPSYEERIPVHSEIRSIEAIDIRESSSEEMQMVYEKSKPEHQIGQNVKKIKPEDVEQVEENLSSISNKEQMPEHSEHQIGQKRVDKPSEYNELEKVQEYEEIGKQFKINENHYYLSAERKTGNKYFQCVHSNSIGKKCQGSISITPNQRIVRKTKHICN